MIAFLLTPVGRWIAGLALIGTLAGVGDVYLSARYYNKGWNAAVAAIAAKDNKALSAVQKAKSDVEDCYRNHRTWDVTNGMCQ